MAFSMKFYTEKVGFGLNLGKVAKKNDKQIQFKASHHTSQNNLLFLSTVYGIHLLETECVNPLLTYLAVHPYA